MSAPAAQPAQSALHVAGPVADTLLEVTTVLTVGAVLIFGGVMLLLAMSLRGGPRPVRARWWLLGGGIAFPVAVLSALFVYGERHRPAWRPVPPADALVVSVTGRMWWWEVRYDDPRTGRRFATANEIRLPAGRPVYFALASEDVIHSFWVPALGGKMDMVPGRMQHLLLQADAPGRWRGQCAEYCGEQHARMALDVVALAPADFEAWADAQARPVAPHAERSVQAGREAFLAHRCDACHTVRGVTSPDPDGRDVRRGPDLTHVGGRLSLGAATVPNTPETMREWVAHTQQLKPGARMPAGEHRLPPAAIEDIAAWLSGLK